MPKVMSPLAPEHETQGARAALRFYTLMSSYTSSQVVKSAIGLYPILCKNHGYEFANGFLDFASIIAQSRLLRNF